MIYATYKDRPTVEDTGIDRKINATEIIPGLYVGNRLAATSSDFMQKHNIKAVVNCAIRTVSNKFGSQGVEYASVLLADNPGANILPWFPSVLKFIGDNRYRCTDQSQVKHSDSHESHGINRRVDTCIAPSSGSVLVHCEMGVSRSCTFIIAFLMVDQHLSRDDAYIAVKSKRPQCEPNITFWEHLGVLERMLQQDNSLSFDSLHATFDELRPIQTHLQEWIEYSICSMISVGDITSLTKLRGSMTQIDRNTLALKALEVILEKGRDERQLAWLRVLVNETNTRQILRDHIKSPAFEEAWGCELRPQDKIGLMEV